MTLETISPETQVMKFILGKWISKPIHAAATLEISDILSLGKTHIDDLAKLTQTHPDALYRLMRALSGMGIFVESDPSVFENTPLSECLMEGRLRSASLLFHSEWHDKMWDNLLHSLHTGGSAFEKVFGEPAFDWFKGHPEAAAVFHQANAVKASAAYSAVARNFDFTGIDTLVDVGGGFGGFIGEILKENPMMNGIVAELPETIDLASKHMEKMESTNRIQAVECDFFNHIPMGADAYLLSNILHDWPDNKCLAILKNCRKAIKPDGKLIIAEALIEPGNAFSLAKLLDLEVLLMEGGRERSQKEFNALLKVSGFRLVRILPADDTVSIIEAIPRN